MIIVHHLNNSRSQRILWLLEELGAPYEVVRYERDPATMRAPDALRRIHPLGKSPVITENGQTIAESGAIVEYLLETHGQGRLIPPVGTPDRQRYRYWLHYAEGSAMPLLLLKLVFMRMPQGPMPFFARPIARAISAKGQAMLVDPQLKTHMDYWEAELSRGDWFAGPEMTGADIQMSFPLEAATARAGVAGPYPKIKAFLDRIHARPAYQRALQAGGPYELLK